MLTDSNHGCKTEKVLGVHKMHCWIEISRGALLHNYSVFVEILGENRVVPVLKSNAYGHGLEEVYEVLQETKPKYIGVTYTNEARVLRSRGFSGRILNVGPVVEEDIRESAILDVELILASEDMLDFWRKEAKRPKIHLKIDTGLSRRGLSLEEFTKQLSKLLVHKNEIVGIATHLANVEDVTNTDFARAQLDRFLQAIKLAKGAGFESLLRHSASSASALLIKEPKFDLNRIGISLYGLWPSEKTRLSYYATPHLFELHLRPVLSWKTRISSVRYIKEGDFVGYGCTFKASHKMKIGVIPVGYYEGYPRLAASHGAYVLVKGRRCSILGRICMNMAMIDLDNSPSANVGDLVTLIGRDGNEELSADQLAHWADTINYELVTRLNSAIPRLIKA